MREEATRWRIWKALPPHPALSLGERVSTFADLEHICWLRRLVSHGVIFS
jgi:hypothetical protein